MKANYWFAIISKHFILFLCTFLVVLLIVFYIQGHISIRDGELLDPDCYTHLNRVVQLHDTGQWYDSVLARSNAPYGESLHWTRPFDVLLLTGAWLLTPLAGFKTGLFWCGVLISPILLIASLIILPWAFRPILADNDSNLMRLLFIFQLGVISYYSVGRPDHNSLLGFIFIISTGLILRLILGSFNKTICYIAGIVSAFSLWIHVESLLVIFLNILLLGFFWIFEDKDFVKKNMHYSIALLVFTSAALILERPWHDLTSIEYDKISVVHWFIFGLISLFWMSIFYFRSHRIFSHQGQIQRFTMASLGAVIVALCVWLIFPGFYRGGYADVDPRIVTIYLDKVIEVQPPLSRDYIMPLVQLIGSAIIGIFYIVFVLWKEPDKSSKGWIFILSGVLLFTAAGILERRLLLYGNIITLVPLAVILGRALRWEVDHIKFLFRIFILPFTVISFCVAFLLLGFICQEIAQKDIVSKSYNKSVPLSELCDELNNLNEGNAHKTRILAFIYYGPEILYRTDCEVIATPYHRNVQGILDTYRIITAASDEKAHALIHQRGIDMILITNDPGERKYYSAAPEGSIFYDRLKAERSVNWLREVELPPRLSSAYRLFRVVG